MGAGGFAPCWEMEDGRWKIEAPRQRVRGAGERSGTRGWKPPEPSGWKPDPHACLPARRRSGREGNERLARLLEGAGLATQGAASLPGRIATRPETHLTLTAKDGFLCPDKFMALPRPELDDLRIERRTEPSQGRRGLHPYRKLVAVTIGGLLLAGAVIWWLNRPKAIEVRTVVAREAGGTGAERTVLNASGYVTARRAATVSSKVTGKVTEVQVEEGMKVEEGQVLARLDDTNVKASLLLVEAQLESARRTLEETRVRLKEAEQELERQAGLVKNRIATQAD